MKDYEKTGEKIKTRMHLMYKVFPEFFRWYEKIVFFGRHGR